MVCYDVGGPFFSVSNAKWRKVANLPLRYGAKADIRTVGGHFPLHLLISRELAKLLLPVRFHVINMKNEEGDVPLHCVSDVLRCWRLWFIVPAYMLEIVVYF